MLNQRELLTVEAEAILKSVIQNRIEIFNKVLGFRGEKTLEIGYMRFMRIHFPIHVNILHSSFILNYYGTKFEYWKHVCLAFLEPTAYTLFS